MNKQQMVKQTLKKLTLTNQQLFFKGLATSLAKLSVFSRITGSFYYLSEYHHCDSHSTNFVLIIDLRRR